jgi:hypothetical protein
VTALSFGTPITTALAATHSAATAFAAHLRLAGALAQDGDSDEDTEVSSDQIEKYVAVYKDMQRNRSLSVEQAAAKEGLSLGEFRDLEQKVGHDDLATERARHELQADAAQGAGCHRGSLEKLEVPAAQKRSPLTARYAAGSGTQQTAKRTDSRSAGASLCSSPLHVARKDRPRETGAAGSAYAARRTNINCWI